MPSRAEPTNRDIINLLSEISADLGELKAEVAVTKDQVFHTNGRLRKIEEWRSNQDAIEAYKAKQPMTEVKVQNNNAWDWKAIGTAIGLAAVGVAAVLVQIGGSK